MAFLFIAASAGPCNLAETVVLTHSGPSYVTPGRKVARRFIRCDTYSMLCGVSCTICGARNYIISCGPYGRALPDPQERLIMFSCLQWMGWGSCGLTGVLWFVHQLGWLGSIILKSGISKKAKMQLRKMKLSKEKNNVSRCRFCCNMLHFTCGKVGFVRVYLLRDILWYKPYFTCHYFVLHK